MIAWPRVSVLLLFGASTLSIARTDVPAPNLPGLQQRLGVMAVPFVPNAGQWDRRAAFAAQTFAGTLFVTTEGRLLYRLRGRMSDRGPAPDLHAIAPGWVLTETPVDPAGRALTATPRGENLQQGKISYAIGNDETRHRDGLDTFELVSLGEVYPGVTVQLRATGRNVEKIFAVAPQRDPAAIRIKLEGAGRIELGPDGELIANTGNGPVTYTRPIGYQLDALGNRTNVPVLYALDATSATYGFTAGRYDRSRTLIIDPLLQSTYSGGNTSENLRSMAIHPATGDVYVGGSTTSTDFPDVAGAEQTVKSTGIDGFISRFNAALTIRLQSTYLGGDGDDHVRALAIHPITGEVYVAGSTSSTDFPKVAGSEQTAKGAGTDAFVARLNATLTTRLQSTYLGGNSTDVAFAMAIHPVTGDVYVTGNTLSTDFPKVAGSEQPAKSTGNDVFVARLNATLTTRLQSTYLGGTGEEFAYSLAIHPVTGEVYVAGSTTSTDFPKVSGAEQSSIGSYGFDAFVTRLDAGLLTRRQSTYLGGDGASAAFALAIHPATGDIYVAGSTGAVDFPKVTGAVQNSNFGGSSDAFVTRLDAALTALVQSTYLGGAGQDVARAIAIHGATGDIYVAGETDSTNFPITSGAEQETKGASVDAFVSRIDARLTTGLKSTYLGGDSVDLPLALAIHPGSGEVYVAGSTSSTNFPKVSGAEQTSEVGASDAFISRYSLDLLAGGAVPNAFGFPPKLGVAPGSLQSSAAAQILGIAGAVEISISGGAFAQYCISSTASCGCELQAFTNSSVDIAAGQFVCVRQRAPLATPAVNVATIIVGGGVAQFVVAAGVTGCSLDVDGNGSVDALTDGVMLMRAMFGLTGTAVTNNAVGAGATRSTWAQMQPYLNGNCATGFAL